MAVAKCEECRTGRCHACVGWSINERGQEVDCPCETRGHR